jgi:hypothetical protein
MRIMCLEFLVHTVLHSPDRLEFRCWFHAKCPALRLLVCSSRRGYEGNNPDAQFDFDFQFLVRLPSR